MKHFKIFCAGVVLAALAACGGQAHAQTLANQVKISETASADISHARAVKIGAGSYIVDSAGAQRPAVFENAALSNSEFFLRNYLHVGGGVYYNAAAASAFSCEGSVSVISWPNGTSQALNDGCAISDLFKAYARR